ncbi:hypothetical protein SPRG_01717 [Saprolegnia parasitica CBS 223.65]|uniref:DUF6818 domain-containing protein n=1 Tax=Saprolegnia parasitica (strain CBS 223.65) TaxID=695850 RepID=A0A067CTK9_SAPPC|nr:hypothetical protein SPRG_01717 [Saprolegnia parasitica CBS 223.65]KDO33838.1 hypothetical protein SPRG_01717 [Saprolegnia parasitica CBS 223.65]|eukprot:XP_012195474.1 hypothetical protein SPRG_01717 [Saprolegnia parasitica CBS 223.65]
MWSAPSCHSFLDRPGASEMNPPRAPAPTKPPRVSVGVPNWAKSDVDILLSLVGELLPLTQPQWQRLAQIYNKHPDRLHERDWEAAKRKFNKLRSTGRAGDPDCPEDARWARALQHEIELKGDKNYHEDDDAGSSRGDSSTRDDDEAAVDHPMSERRETHSDGDAQSIARVVPPATDRVSPELPRASRVAVGEPSERSYVETARRVRKRAHDESVTTSDADATVFKRLSPAMDAETLQRGGLSTEIVTLLMLMDERSQLRMEQREEREDARRREREEREEARRLAMEERYLMEQRIRDEQRRKDEMRHERTERLQMLLFSKLLGVDVSKVNEDPPTN